MFHVAKVAPLVHLKTISTSKPFATSNAPETSEVIRFSARFLGTRGKRLVAGSATRLGKPVSNVFVILFTKVLQFISTLNRAEAEEDMVTLDVSEFREGPSTIIHGPGSVFSL